MNEKNGWIYVNDELPMFAYDVELICHGELCKGYYHNDVWHIDDASDPNWGVDCWRKLDWNK